MSDNKTEPPSQRKLREAREKGNVLKSKEVISAAGMLTFTLIFAGYVTMISSKMEGLFLIDTWVLTDDFSYTYKQMMSLGIKTVLWGVFPVVGLIFFSVLVAHLAQFGLLFTFQPFTQGGKKLNFIANAKQMFAKKALFGFLMNVAKVVSVTWLLTIIIIDNFSHAISASMCGISCALGVFYVLVLSLLLYSTLATMVVATLDFVVQKHFYTKELSMTKEEVKREMKDDEGDPEIKSKRKQMYQEMGQETTQLAATRNATVVVKNPTHYAVALFYDDKKTPLPTVLSKGEGAMAKQILKIAKEEGIPVFQNVDLARALYHKGGINTYIPEELIDDVVLALKFVEKLKKKRY